MSDEDTTLTGAPPAAPAETTQENTAPSASAEGQDKPADSEPSRDEKGRFVSRDEFQRRVNDLTRNWRQTERERDAYAEQLRLVQSQQAKPPASDDPPTLESFDFDPAKWSRAMAEHAAREAEKRVEAKWREQETQRTHQQMAESFGKRERDYAAKHPDYADTVQELARAVQFPPQVLEVFGSSEHGPALLHHLATNLDEADRVARLSPHLAALELGRIEARITAPKPKPVTNAPAPAPSLSGGSTVQKDPDRMTPSEWLVWRNDQLKARR